MVPCNIRCAFPFCDTVRFLCAGTFPCTLLYKFPFHSTYFSIRFPVRFVLPYPVHCDIRNPCVLRWLPSGFPPTLGLAFTSSPCDNLLYRVIRTHSPTSPGMFLHKIISSMCGHRQGVDFGHFGFCALDLHWVCFKQEATFS